MMKTVRPIFRLKRDNCAHNSCFIPYDRDDADSFFLDVSRNIEKVAQACEDCLFATYSKEAISLLLDAYENHLFVKALKSL